MQGGGLGWREPKLGGFWGAPPPKFPPASQVGVKGNPQGFNRGLDCDVIVAEVSRRDPPPPYFGGFFGGGEPLEGFGVCPPAKKKIPKPPPQVRSTSHKPDEIYGMIERLSPGTRKIELFGRPHNVQPNW